LGSKDRVLYQKKHNKQKGFLKNKKLDWATFLSHEK